MDAFINNTSWAFIKSLGFDIKGYATSYTNPYQGTASFSVPSFNKAFVDIFQSMGSTFVMTIRPFLCDATITNAQSLYSLWITNTGNYSYMLLPSTINSDYPNSIKIDPPNLITIYINNKSAQSQIGIAIYVIE